MGEELLEKMQKMGFQKDSYTSGARE